MWKTKVAHQDVEIDAKEFIIGHGKSTFMKPEKVAKLERENATGGKTHPFSLMLEPCPTYSPCLTWVPHQDLLHQHASRNLSRDWSV